ncbi:Tripartite-type tricarboxylate transporter receptor subunit TctC [Chelatococcus asaccharovorans]|uniref:Tripartite-type tricarboxylate transporter receptor subunit TctC n=2 Tax=Chelatococcus asaccharovorans TaxID=28210 RepID=A0A2V3U9K5_9HYPH|nr:tripartite tricarboxylate transporter substrate binding protein [Chelatococcus asaccharovorans]PXW60080.1 tripartite-type tricarboxylate transporter receptor subunit TctC [Chelatococcus asaccharovorans]CAH1656062.1 Tripartite-type tricarboxylate transporter receptor subunit TctC [Chelatococcus asaccharovorans]CAH1685233.1 Tripartite-type tricarboxylate transporter receptor subunit TctC [Chelatococcus asaccharovorans]
MRKLVSTLSLGALLLAGTIGLAGKASAEDWPNRKTITAVFPFAAGSDYIARIVMGAVEKEIGQRILIDNRPGAGGAIGTGYAARQPADGYTFVFAYPGPAANFTNTFAGLPYKPLEDFEYVSGISKATMVIVARTGLPFTDFKGMIEYAKANPGKLSVSNSGIGTYGHMVELAFSDLAGIKMKMVPYKGNSEVVTDMLSGSLDMSMDFLNNNYMKQIEAGTIRPLAIVSAERAADLPNVPTFKESGIDLVAQPWAGLMAPKGTPPSVIERMNKAVVNYLNTDEAKQAFAKIGQQVNPTTPKEFRDVVVSEEVKWRDLIAKYEIKNQ